MNTTNTKVNVPTKHNLVNYLLVESLFHGQNTLSERVINSLPTRQFCISECKTNEITLCIFAVRHSNTDGPYTQLMCFDEYQMSDLQLKEYQKMVELWKLSIWAGGRRKNESNHS